MFARFAIRNSRFAILLAAILFSNNKKERSVLRSQHRSGSLPKSLRNQLLRFRERESAPAGSTTAIIGEQLLCRFAKAYEALAVRLHIQM